MQITAEWVAVLLTALGMGGAIGSWVQRRLDATRRAVPILRAQWHYGTGGFTAEVEIVNRLDEDLLVETVAARGPFVRFERTSDGAGGFSQKDVGRDPSPKRLGHTVQPLARSSLSISVDGDATEPWLGFTISSSARTLRRKRLSVRDSQKP